MRRITVVLGSSFLALTAVAGCRNSSTDSSDNGSGGETSSTHATGATGTGTGTGGSGGSTVTCTGDDHTIQELTSGTVGKGSKVTVRNVVAMSQKFLVSGKNSCLWGVFISAPGLTETAENSGILALSYGTDPVIPEGGTKALCPKLGQAPAGDKIPDNVKPGDQLDMTGQTDYFPSSFSCTAPDPQNAVPMRQLTTVCSATVTGTAPVPAAHVMSGAELTSLTSTTDASFHDKWGGVKVRVEDVAVVPEGGMVVGMYGIIHLAGDLPVGDKPYYRPYSTNKCQSGPVFTNPAMTFTAVEAFHYLDFCAWGLQANDKCADFAPSSEDCAGALTCPPDMLQ